MGRPSFKETKLKGQSALSSKKRKNKPSNQPLKLVGAFHTVEFDKQAIRVTSHHDGTPVLQDNKIERIERLKFHKKE
jgi:hypothetical protein